MLQSHKAIQWGGVMMSIDTLINLVQESSHVIVHQMIFLS